MWATLVGISKRTTTDDIVDAKMMQFVYFSLHAYLHFPKRIKVFENTEKHYDKVSPPIKTLHISFTSGCFKADLLDLLLIE